MIDYEELILARQDMMEIFEDDADVYESLLSGDYFELDDNIDLWLWEA